MTDPLRLLGANIRVAANLRYADEREADYDRWAALDTRLQEIGCRLQRDCCNLAIYDRNGEVIDISGVSDEASQDYPLALAFTEKLELSDGVC